MENHIQQICHVENMWIAIILEKIDPYPNHLGKLILYVLNI
jgi:hypothetical protein